MVAADAATAPPNTAAGYCLSSAPNALSRTTSVRVLPSGATTPAVTTPGQARTELIDDPAGALSVACHSRAPLLSW